MAGLKIAAVLTGASGAELVVREELDPQELLADAGMVDLPLTITRAALVNKMLYKQDKLFCLDELAAMADRLLGGQSGVLVSVDDGVPAEEPASRLVTELVGECKGILAGHSLYPAAKLAGLTVADVAGRSGVIHRLNETSCPVHEAQAQLLALRQQSCGKCTFCREGLYQLSALMEDAANGRSKPADMDLAKEIGQP